MTRTRRTLKWWSTMIRRRQFWDSSHVRSLPRGRFGWSFAALVSNHVHPNEGLSRGFRIMLDRNAAVLASIHIQWKEGLPHGLRAMINPKNGGIGFGLPIDVLDVAFSVAQGKTLCAGHPQPIDHRHPRPIIITGQRQQSRP